MRGSRSFMLLEDSFADFCDELNAVPSPCATQTPRAEPSMPLSHTDGDSWIPTLMNRDSNLPDLLWVSTTSVSVGKFQISVQNYRPFLSLLLQAALSLSFPLTCSVLAFSHPAQQGEQLAAITHTQTECVVPPPEAIKLSLGLGVICNSSSPTYNKG